MKIIGLFVVIRFDSTLALLTISNELCLIEFSFACISGCGLLVFSKKVKDFVAYSVHTLYMHSILKDRLYSLYPVKLVINVNIIISYFLKEYIKIKKTCASATLAFI